MKDDTLGNSFVSSKNFGVNINESNEDIAIDPNKKNRIILLGSILGIFSLIGMVVLIWAQADNTSDTIQQDSTVIIEKDASGNESIEEELNDNDYTENVIPYELETPEFDGIEPIDDSNLTNITDETNIQCFLSSFKMAFILLGKNKNDFTNERIKLIEDIKKDFSEGFKNATGGLSTMDTTYEVVTIIDNGLMVFEDDENVNKITVVKSEVAKEFHKNNPEEFDFITIYTAFETDETQNHENVMYNIKNIGLDTTYNQLERFGYPRKLIGANHMGYIDTYNDPGKYMWTRGLLHETGHQWCCYLGENFNSNEYENQTLPIIQQGIHGYNGLECPNEGGCPMNYGVWKEREDGNTYHRVYSDNEGPKYHPIVLMNMGLVEPSEIQSSYKLYSTNTDNRAPYGDEQSEYLGDITIEEILEYAGGEPACAL